MACVTKSVSGCLAQSSCTLEFLNRQSSSTCSRLGGQWSGFANCTGGRMQRSVRQRRSLYVSAIAEKTEESPAEPVFKLKIENDEDAPPEPALPRWTGLVEKDTAGQTNIYSVEPTVYVADNMLSTNSRGTDGSSSNTVAFIGTALLFTALAIGGAVNISQYKASEQAASVAGVEYAGPALSFYIEKFSASAPAVAPPLAGEVAVPTEPTIPEVEAAVAIEPGVSTEPSVPVPEVEAVVAVPEPVAEAEVEASEPAPAEPEAAVVEEELSSPAVSLPSIDEAEVQTAALTSELTETEAVTVVEESAVAPGEEAAAVAVSEA